MKRCRRCKIEKEFPKEFRSKQVCLGCAPDNPEYWIRQAWLALPAERRRFELLLKREYGIKKADYDRMLEEQDGLCAICHQPNTHKKHKRLSVDHDHATGRVRGLLCHTCNVGLGAFKDNVEVLAQAIEYLK
jgi:hypothetical protein